MAGRYKPLPNGESTPPNASATVYNLDDAGPTSLGLPTNVYNDHDPPTFSFSSPNRDAGKAQFAFSTSLRKATSDDPYASGPSYPPPPANGHAPLSSTQHQSPSGHYTHLSVFQTLNALRCPSLESGLSARDVPAARTEAGGYNEFAVKGGEEPWRKFLGQFQEPLILLLLGSAGVSLLIGQIDDAVSITVAIVIVISVGFYQEQKSEKSLEALNKLVPHYCHLVRDGVTSTVLANELVPGDVVTFSTGDRIPADLRICQAVSLEIDESTLTGEIKPRRKHSETIPEHDSSHNTHEHGSFGAESSNLTSINERENVAFMGTLVKSGHGRGVVIATGQKTEFGMIFSMVDEVSERRTPLQLSMDELAKRLSIISFVIIAVICFMGIAQHRHWLEMFTIGVSLAVAAIPEGLPIVVTVTLALGVLRMSNRKAIVKKLPSVETLGSVSVICSDKTGTLTSNEMTVVKVFTAEDGILDLSKSVPHTQSRALAKSVLTGNICNNSHRDETGKNVGQATDVAMVNVLRLFGLEDKRPYFKRSSEVPFDSETKFMSVNGTLSTAVPATETTYLKGAYEVVLEKCTTAYGPEGKTINLDATLRKEISAAAVSMSSEGLRVLATATGPAGSSEAGSMIFCGLQAMQDPPRPGVKEAISSLAEGGVQVVMITGDAETTAMAMAKQLGITASASSTAVMTGKQLDTLSERQLQERIRNVSVFARVTPRHKMIIISAFQANGEIVAMTGDGVNDAPALKMADIGISMGKGGTDVAKEAADVILVDDNFATILPAVEEGKGIFFNIQNFLSFQLSTAVAALTLITLSTAFRLSLPLNAMQILFINILMDGPPSQSLGVDPVDRSVMSKPPRPKNAPVLNRRLLYRIAFSASVIVIGTLWVYVTGLKSADGLIPGDGYSTEAANGMVVDQRDSTMTFTTFVFLDLTSALQNRGLTTPLNGNRMLTITLSISLITQLCLIYLPLLQGIFQTTSLSLGDLSSIVVISGISFTLHEGRRWFERVWFEGKSGLLGFKDHETYPSTLNHSRNGFRRKGWEEIVV
ncbi:calcium-transporting P [Violaceomyces palustris]|uniref:Calcium-transporting P n=1 Tax=Violaceomyces palustris TaxID=1673888 RepID=A0ACD0P089_9BASI|nr:calcium-transporting P [Violaceomyces palustris]